MAAQAAASGAAGPAAVWAVAPEVVPAEESGVARAAVAVDRAEELGVARAAVAVDRAEESAAEVAADQAPLSTAATRATQA